MGIVIRRAEEKDTEWLISRFKLHAEDYDTHYNFIGTDDHIAGLIANVVKNHYAIVAEKDGELVGYNGGIIHNHMFNEEIKVLAQMFWWVEPMVRGTRVAKLLLDEFIKYGEENCNWITMNIHNANYVKDHHFIRRGFDFKEKVFLKEVF